MKGHLHNSLRALFLSLAVLLSLPMLAVKVTIDGINYDLNAEAEQATVVSKSDKYSGEVVIPESVEYDGTAYSVTSIGDEAFEWCSGLTSVTIGNSVKSIGSYAFYYCSGLTSVTIPNSVTNIGNYAFNRCSGITSVTIPNSVTSIGYGAFQLCSGLTSVTIPNSVTSIGNYAFYECSGLTSVTIGSGVTSIGQSTFEGCSGLISVIIPNSVTSIGESAFRYCSGLTSVHISDIAAWCNIDFSGSDSNPLNNAGAGHLYVNGEEVKDLVIPNSVTSIRDYAFYGFSGLTSVTIPNSVTSIGERAFYKCSGLTSVTIGNGVTSIGDYAFQNCTDLTSVTIGNSVTSIGGCAFQNCDGLTSVTIPNSVTSIGQNAFNACDGLTSVTIGNSVESIGPWAFAYCSVLTSVTIGNGETSIGDYAFYCCSGMTSVIIGNSVTSIGEDAFYKCSKLHDVYCHAENVPYTQYDAFEDSPLQNATLHVPATSVDSYKASAPWSGFGKIVGLPKEYSLTVSSVGYATLYLDFNAEIPEDVEAYVAKEVVDSRLKMERVEGVLPTNTGVIIMAEEGTYAFVESDKTPAEIEKNLLKGTVEKTEITAEANTSYYVLSAPDGVVAMYLALLTDNKFWNNANKAYLPINYGDLGIFDDEVDSSVEQLSRRLVFDFDDETGINELKGENGKVKTALYDLSGRRVQKAQKGIFIQNGKVVVK